MPLDPSVLLRQTRRPEYPDPVEEYKGFLSLRQMMDLGKLRKVQLQQEELENEQKRQKLAEYNQFREEAPTWGENPTPAQAARFPTYGLPYVKSLREAQSAGLTQ